MAWGREKVISMRLRRLRIVVSALIIGYGLTGTTWIAASIPSHVQRNLEAIAEPFMNRVWWTPMKVPGLEDQVLNAHRPGAGRVWENVAPGFANVIYDVRVSNGVITAVLDLGGVIQSQDGGASWRQLSYRLPGNGVYASFFSCDVSPADPDLIVLGGSWLSRTRNHGEVWEEVYPGPSNSLPPFKLSPAAGDHPVGFRDCFGRVRFNTDGSRVFAALGAFGHDFKPRFKHRDAESDMATQYTGKKVYVGDASATSFSSYTLGESFAGIRCIAPHPANPDIVYFSFGDGSLYVTRTATQQTVSFTQLTHLSGYQVIDVDVSGGMQPDILLTVVSLLPADPTSSDDTRIFKVFKTKDVGTSILSCTEVEFKDSNGSVITYSPPVSAKWNPRIVGGVFVGIRSVPFILVSDDSGQSFKKKDIPEPHKHDLPQFYTSPQWFSLDRSSSLAVTWSCIGGWFSKDGFDSWNDLLMKPFMDGATRFLGNKGLGFAESVMDIVVGGGRAYLCTNDHGLFRSRGGDYRWWDPISDHPGMPMDSRGKPCKLFFPMGVSPDGQKLYAVARGGEDPYSTSDMKLVRSLDSGNTWSDVTALLSSGSLLSSELVPKEFVFGQGSRYEWLMFDKALFVSTDNGLSFSRTVLPAAFSGCTFRNLWYDVPRSILYVSCTDGLLRSRDGGLNWDVLTKTFVKAVGGNARGDLVLLMGSQLVRAPFDWVDKMAGNDLFGSGIPRAFVKATIGDSLTEITTSQTQFTEVFCSGNVIIVGVRSGVFVGNRVCPVGPLVSADGGVSFHWETHDHPSSLIYDAAITPQYVLLGCAGGLYARNLVTHPFAAGPVLEPVGSRTVPAGQPLVIRIHASGPENSTLQYSASGASSSP